MEGESNLLGSKGRLLHDVLEAQHHSQFPLQLLLVGSTFCQVADGLETTASHYQLTVTSTQRHRWANHETHQQCGIDNLRVGVIQEEDESWQAALVLDNGPAVHGVGGQVPQLVDDGQGVRLHTHGCTRPPIQQLTDDS